MQFNQYFLPPGRDYRTHAYTELVYSRGKGKKWRREDTTTDEKGERRERYERTE